MSLSALFAMESSWWFSILCPFQHYLPWKGHDDFVFYVPFNIICHGKFMMIWYFMSLSKLFAMKRSWVGILCLFLNYLPWKGHDDVLFYVSFNITCHEKVIMIWYSMSLSPLFAMERSSWFGILCLFLNYLPWRGHELVFYVSFNIICHGKDMMIWYSMSLSTLFAMERSSWFGILCLFQISFSIILVILRWWSDNERLSATKRCIIESWIPLLLELKLGTSSEFMVRNANHSATHTLLEFTLMESRGPDLNLCISQKQYFC